MAMASNLGTTFHKSSSSSSSQNRLQILCRKKDREKGKDNYYPFKVIEITPPPKNLGIRCLPANMQCGESVTIEGQIYMVSAVTHRYQLRRGKYEPSEKRLDVLSSGSPPQHLPPKNQSTNERVSSVAVLDYVMEIGRYPIDPVIKLNHSCKTTLNNLQNHKLPNSLSLDKSCNSIKGEMLVVGSSDSMGNETETVSPEQHFTEAASGDPLSDLVLDELPETCIEHPTDDSVICNSNCSLKLEDSFSNPSHEASEQQNGQLAPQSSIDCSSRFDKSSGSAKVSNSCDLVESRKTSMCRGSTGSDVSEDSSTSTFSSAISKPHKGNDTRWEAIQAIQSQDGMLGLNHFRLLRKLGSGDIGSVYLCELSGTKSYFAMKVMDKTALASRKKLVRAQTEREILQSLDHPFLPTLYTHFETEKFSCLVMEFCPGGDLHALRQRQPGKLFTEQAARFYVAEVLLALEYLHMLGIIYRDLKPENVLVRDDGHIMLSDFDLSLICAVCPTLVRSSNTKTGLSKKNSGYCVQPDSIESTCVITPACIQPTCFMPSFLSRKSKKEKKNKPRNEANNQVPELLAEPTSARSMSFVGTHEYLAPEIVKGEGHGSAVDWWTFGIFLYELLFGKTPFKGSGNRATLLNVVGQPLRFPESPSISFAARDLIRGLLVKEPKNRLAHRRGATEIKQHPFFQNVNWALIRCTNPPQVPKPFKVDLPPMKEMPKAQKEDNNVPVPVPVPVPGVDVKPSGNNYLEIDFF